MADVSLQQILHTAGKEPLSTTSGALHTQVQGTDGLAPKTLKTDTDGKLIVSHDSGLATEATLAAINTALDTLNSNVSTEAKLEAIRVLLATTQTYASDIFLAIRARDWAKETTLSAIHSAIATLSSTVSTEAKLEAVRALVASLDNTIAALAGVEYARDGTVGAVGEAVDTIVGALGSTADAAAKSTDEVATAIALLKGLLGQASGVQRVELTGNFDTLRTPAVGRRTVTATAAELFAGASRLASRRRLVIRNEDPVLRCLIGPATVSQQTGFPIEPGAVLEVPCDPEVAVPVYAISEGASLTVAVMEI